MPDFNQIGNILQAAGAGLGGKGLQFQQLQNQERERQRQAQIQQQQQQRQGVIQGREDLLFKQDQAKQAQVSEADRMKTMFTGALAVQDLLDQDDIEGAHRVAVRRLTALKENFPDVDHRATGIIADQLGLAREGSADNLAAARKTIDSVVREGRANKILPDSSRVKSSDITNGQIVKELPDGTFVAKNIEGLKTENGKSSPFQFGRDLTLKDSKGNLFTQTQARNPDTGGIESIIAPMQKGGDKPTGSLSVVGSYGLTAGEKVSQISQETNAQTKAAANATEVSNYKKSGLKAKGLLRDTNRLLELNELIETGKTAPAKLAYAKLFGIDDPSTANLGEFNAKSGQLVLGMIKQLGANPTEGERAFLQEIGPAIGQGKAINRSILTDLKRIQERQVARAKFLAKNPSAGINDLLLLNEEFKSEGAPTASQAEGGSVMRFDAQGNQI